VLRIAAALARIRTSATRGEELSDQSGKHDPAITAPARRGAIAEGHRRACAVLRKNAVPTVSALGPMMRPSRSRQRRFFGPENRLAKRIAVEEGRHRRKKGSQTRPQRASAAIRKHAKSTETADHDLGTGKSDAA